MAKQHQPNRKRRLLKPEDVRDIFHAATSVGEGAMPTKAVGWTDLRGRWQRLEATYPNGWIVSIVLDDKGDAAEVSSRKPLLVVRVSG